MKDELNIPVPKEEDFVAANKRRDKYALTRDLQALEFNQAILSRIEEGRSIVVCKECGKEFIAGKETGDSLTCPKCK